MGDQELGELGVLSVLHEMNRQIQDYLSVHGDQVPDDLTRLLDDLDWTVRNGYAETREGVVRHLRRRSAETWGAREVLRQTVRDAVDRLRTRRVRARWQAEVPTPEPPDGEAAEGEGGER